MNIKGIQACLQQIHDSPPLKTTSHNDWLAMEDVVAFLEATSKEYVPLYISSNALFVNTIVAPERMLVGDFMSDLMKWNCSVSGGWGYGGHRVSADRFEKEIYPPGACSGSTILDSGRAVVFRRWFARHRPEAYCEIDQQLVHVLGLHWMEDRKAFCALDERGDLRDAITVKETEHGIVVAIQKADLDFFLYLSDSSAVRMFDAHRPVAWSLKEGHHATTTIEKTTAELRATLLSIQHPEPANNQAILRGVQVIRRGASIATMEGRLEGGKDEPTEIVSFAVWDSARNRMVEWPADEAALEEQSLFPLTPVCFNPEVLLRYQQHPEKYVLGDRRLTCRGAWMVKFGMNAEGQVFVYIYDVAKLPVFEQKAWKAFNEAPKAGIPEHIYKSDFLGEFDLRYEPLQSLVEALKEFPRATQDGGHVEVWKPKWDRYARTFERLNHPVVGTAKEYEDAVGELAKVVVDGFVEPVIRLAAKALDCDQAKMKQVGLLRACMLAMGLDPTAVEASIGPLNDLLRQRASFDAHAGGEVPAGDRKDAFLLVAKSVDSAVRAIAHFVADGGLDVPARKRGT